MSNGTYFSSDQTVALTSRAGFIRQSYLYLCVALAGFLGLSALLFASGAGYALLRLLGASQWGWLLVLGAFMVVGIMATRLADQGERHVQQLLGLGIYVLAQAIIFSPLLAIAAVIDPTVIPTAGIVTAMLVAGLTFTAFTTKKDFSFLAPILTIGGFIALGVIVCAILFGFELGVLFSGVMVCFAAGCVLFDTSRIIHHYPADRPAGAALHLFASIALMLWYVISLLLRMRE